MEKYIKNKYFIASSLLILFCVCLMFFTGVSSNSIEGVISKYERAINSGNNTKILNCFDEELTQQYEMEKMFAGEISLVDNLGYSNSKVDFLIHSIEMKSETEAEVSCFIIVKDKETGEESVHLDMIEVEKSNGTWLINY